MSKFILYFFIIFFSLSLAIKAEGKNYIKNGGFEKGMDKNNVLVYWNNDSPKSYSLSSDVKSGKKSLQVEVGQLWEYEKRPQKPGGMAG